MSMKLHYLAWILRQVFKSPCAEFSMPIQCKNGWICTLTDKVNGQVYLCNFIPIESTKIVTPQTADELLNSQEDLPWKTS